MTVRKTLTVNIEDIKALDFHCKCGASVSLPLTKHLPARIACFGCGQTIVEADLANGKNVALHRLMAALADWYDKTDRTCEVTFTLDAGAS